MSLSRRGFLTQIAVASLGWPLCGSGCALLSGAGPADPASLPALTPLIAARDTIELEVCFVDRRIGDPLIGESLWSNLYPITSMAADSCEQLRDDGFRFAMSPARPSQQLLSLIRLSNDNDPARRVLWQQHTLFSGQEGQLVVSDVPDGTPLTITRDGQTRTLELRQASCHLRMRAERMDDRWARLELIPEIHHGAVSLRPQATDDQWLMRQGQDLLPFYEDRLTAELNEGEIVVLGLDGSLPAALASHFFRSDVSRGIERLLLIRLANMRRVQPVRVE